MSYLMMAPTRCSEKGFRSIKKARLSEPEVQASADSAGGGMVWERALIRVSKISGGFLGVCWLYFNSIFKSYAYLIDIIFNLFGITVLFNKEWPLSSL